MTDKPYSKKIEEYFNKIDKSISSCYKLADKARSKGFDPELKIDIPLASNISERVEGLISAANENILKSGISERIKKLEEEFGSLDWRVALKISEEVAKQKFCKFKTELEAMEIAIRIGLAYITLGVIAAPLEGFIELKIKKTKDDKKYFSAFFSGPIRAAGGTAAAVTIIIADYVRYVMGYQKYDPTDIEVKRYITEISDYHERVTNLQYFPSEEELEFLLKNLPIEINGDPTEKIDVSNYKDIERIETNKIRGGMCLVVAEGLSQKAPKLYKKISIWGKKFGLDWGWLKKFLDIQKNVKAKTKSDFKSDEKITPNYTYVKDMVAGRPVFSHPLKNGGFRLRYGRSRTSGFAADSIHPATMLILLDFLATGTQLKVERPGKATVVSPNDNISGPIVKLKNGDVLKIQKTTEIKDKLNEIDKILFLGDILINYGDFSENGHKLVPAGYCEEWWFLELKERCKKKDIKFSPDSLTSITQIDIEFFENLFKDKIKTKPTFSQAKNISKIFDISLHPTYTYFWKNISSDELIDLIDYSSRFSIKKEKVKVKKIIIPYNENIKRVFENIGLPHIIASYEFIIIKNEDAECIYEIIYNKKIDNTKDKDTLKILNQINDIKIKDKCGTFIGTRMGRPEKAKMRKLQGSPHILFPVGSQGGRFKSFQETIKKNKIVSNFPLFFCKDCNEYTIYSMCERCKKLAIKKYYCKDCNAILDQICDKKTDFGEHRSYPYKLQSIDINHYFNVLKKKYGLNLMPDMIKGVKDMTNKNFNTEHLLKGILRAKYNIYVNKDGTTRYDMIEMPITHFKLKEIGVGIEKIKELGYTTDIKGVKIKDEDQIIEMLPQDIIIPDCPYSPDEFSSKVLMNVANFIDELLIKLYDQKPHYNIKDKQDLLGKLIIGLAPHTSAGIVGRIIGFSKTQGMYAHPMFHAAMRRNCFDKNTLIPIIEKNNNIKIVKIGEYIEKLKPNKIIDDYNTKEIKIKDLYTIGFDKKNHKNKIVKINNFTKHEKNENLLKIFTLSEREIKVTKDHKFPILKNNKIISIKADRLKINDSLFVPSKKFEESLDKITNLNELNKIINNSDYSKIEQDKIKSIETIKPRTTYCLNVDNNIVLANNIFTNQCDGDEACIMMLMDGLLNFSRQYLPDRRGSRTMDSPLVLTSTLNPAEIDDEVHGMDIVFEYPLELYKAAEDYKNPWDIKITQLNHVLNTPDQYENMGFTHDTDNINAGVLCSSYKTLPSMKDKLEGQMELASKIVAVDQSDVAKLIIERHFIKDAKGNFKKFSIQKFRCVDCNEKFRRPPLLGFCPKCRGKIIFTISEGNIIKYLQPSIELAEKYNVDDYLKQTLEIFKSQVEDMFGKESEKQSGLNEFFN